MRASSRTLRGALLAVALTSAVAVPASAQPRASQRGAVSQTVNETTISLEYDRPVARGRDVAHEILRWDRPWTPGANRATWIDFSAPVTFQGVEVPAGRYALWTVPHQDEPWEVVLLSTWDTHHLAFDPGAEVARARAAPETGSPMETLAFYFPVVGPYEATLRLHWGDIVVPFTIEVEE